eukprot:TRINITY_DN775938_c0_g1_i1.p1 TRINITY_DN775938_c0_g1~~TRINITY_DN775938_c0_g1_i1.p1  ORF type:complete len:771 (+),score=190.54 TRINITY_DN775938_c0_g1_i1:122-2434(+)
MTSLFPRIKKLDESVVNRIAAGEIVVRPASALKEMMENSIDAGATSISITVMNGGLKLLEIKDNGHGIPHQDFALVCERWATSKLAEASDLEQIQTFGFRGEALASISYVSDLSINSMTADDTCCYAADYKDGSLIQSPKACAGTIGTRISVKNMFQGTLRRNSLWKNQTAEYKRILQAVHAYAIHFGGKVSFTLKRGNSVDLNTNSCSNQMDVIGMVYGSKLSKELFELRASKNVGDLEEMPNSNTGVAVKEPVCKVQGAISGPNCPQKTSTFILFINNRLVEHRALHHAVHYVCNEFLPRDSYPFVYLSLEVPSISIDVNVHPTKREVHLLFNSEITSFVADMVTEKSRNVNDSRVFEIKQKTIAGEKPRRRKMKAQGESFSAKTNVSTTGTSSTRIVSANKPREDDTQKTRVDSTQRSLFQFLGRKNEDNKKHDGEDFDDFEPTMKRTPSIPQSLNPKGTNDDDAALLESIQLMKKDIDSQSDNALTALCRNHIFVGAIDWQMALIQYQTKLFVVNHWKIGSEIFRQAFLMNFGNVPPILVEPPLSLRMLVEAAMDSDLDIMDDGEQKANLQINPLTYETGDEIGINSDEDDDEAMDESKEYSRKRLVDVAIEKAIEYSEMLRAYFGIGIEAIKQVQEEDEETKEDSTAEIDALLTAMPELISGHSPCGDGLAEFFAVFPSICWSEEDSCLSSLINAMSRAYACCNLTEASNGETLLTLTSQHNLQHIIFQSMKEKQWFKAPRWFRDKHVVVEVADTKQLYKIFERC